MRDAEAQQMMREVGARYERLAQRVERRAGRAAKGQAMSGSRSERAGPSGPMRRSL
jgi:hypothetical protein